MDGYVETVLAGIALFLILITVEHRKERRAKEKRYAARIEQWVKEGEE